MKAYHTRINDDGQISLSREVMEALRVEAGDLVDVHIDGTNVSIVHHVWTLETVMGSLKTPPHLQHLTMEEIIRRAGEDYAEQKALEFMNLGCESDAPS
jgi:hypothetical protein